MTTWTPSNEAVERAAIAMAERKGYNIVKLKAGYYENDAQTWDDYIDDAITALIAGHEDEAVPEGWKLVPIEPDEMSIYALREAYGKARREPRCGVSGQTMEALFKTEYYAEIKAYADAIDAAPPAPETKK